MNKKIIFVLAALLIVYAVNSLPLFEFFDTQIPEDWTQVQYNDSDGMWTWTGDGSYFFGADDNYVQANSEENSDQIFDVGLFTPAFDCSGMTFVTADFYRNFHASYAGGEASLRVFSGGMDAENFEEELWIQNSSDSFFGVHEVITFNPINYADPANVYLEFRYSTEGNTNCKFFKLDVLMVYESNPGPATVFFSEYIEGSGNNTALEIYNGSGDVIELDNYRINQTVNGESDIPYTFSPLGMTLEAGETWTFVQSGADQSLLDTADEILTEPSIVHFDGNDALELEFNDNGNWILLDVIGNPDESPSSVWDVAGIEGATENHTLVRKPQTIVGNIDWEESAGTEERFSDWIVLPADTFEHLGSFPNFIEDLWAPNYLELNLIGENNVFLDWEAPIPMENGWLYYHDDSVENGVSNGNAGAGLAVQFQPAMYPCNIEQIRFYCEGEGGGDSQDMEVWILDDDMAEILGGPFQITVVPEAWNVIDIPDIEINSGNFLVNTCAVGAVGPYIGRDDDSYEYNRTLWGSPTSGYTDIGAWGMNYTAVIEAFVAYDDIPLCTQNIGKLKKSQNLSFEKKQKSDIILNESQESIVLRNSRNLIGYNIYRNGSLLNEIPTLNTEYYDLNLENGFYNYNIETVYDGGTSELSDAECSIDIIDILPLGLPFIEDWEEGNIYDNHWLPDPITNSYWDIAELGGEHRSVLAYFWSHQTDYAEPIFSFEMDGSELESIELSYDIKLNSASEQTFEELKVEVFNGEIWTTVGFHNNVNGDFDWTSESFDISEFAANSVFQIRFFAEGSEAYNINYWLIDNVYVGSPVRPPHNLSVDHDSGLLSWSAPNSSDLIGYFIYLDGALIDNTSEEHYQFTSLNTNQTYTAGVSAEYPEEASQIEEIEFIYTGTGIEEDVLSQVNSLKCYPNPFNPTTTISFSLTAENAKNAKLEIFNLKGQKVRTFTDFESGNEGQTSVVWNGNDDNKNAVSSGVYFYKLSSGKFSQMKKMVLIK